MILGGIDMEKVTKREKINKKILEDYSDELTSFNDLLGDNEQEMSKLFYLVNRHFLYMLDNDPNVSIREKDIKFRKKFYKLLKLLGPSMLGCSLKIEDRNEFADGVDDRIYNNSNDSKPVIYVANHGFRDDALATVLAANSHSYIYWGSLPLFYNTFDGLASSLVGEVVMNRKSKSSKLASIDKSLKVLEYGTNLIIFPEGGWNKTSEKMILDLWRGVYVISKAGNYDVVPIVHYVKDPEIIDKKNIIHTIVDKKIPLYNYEEKEALVLLRDLLASWEYKMMEKYGKSTRSEEMEGFSNSDEKWDSLVEKRMEYVTRYDSSIEKKCDYRPKDTVRPEDVFEAIANIENITSDNISMVNEAKKIVKERKFSDFQRRY